MAMRRTLVDLHKGDGGYPRPAWPRHRAARYLAVGTAEGGSELTAIHILDARTSEPLGDVLPFAGGGASAPQALAWDADERRDLARFDAPTRASPLREFDAYPRPLVIGEPVAKDRVVFGKGYSRVASTSSWRAKSGKSTALLANEGVVSPAEVYLRAKARASSTRCWAARPT